MKVLGFEEIPIAHMNDLPTGEEWRDLCETAEVRARAKSIANTMLLQEPGVRKRDLRVIWGRRRIAAHDVLGYRKVLCKMVECDDEELAVLRSIENIEREHRARYTGQTLAHLVEFYERQEATGDVNPLAPKIKRKGRKRNARGRAVHTVASLTGHSEDSIRSAMMRAQKRGEKLPAADVVSDAGSQIIDARGQEIDPNYLLEITTIRATLIHCQRQLTSIKGRLTTAITTPRLPFPKEHVGRVQQKAGELHRLIGSLIPKSLCPYCLAGAKSPPDQCAACLGAGIVGDSVLENLPKEMR